jgi:hypothetical protein
MTMHRLLLDQFLSLPLLVEHWAESMSRACALPSPRPRVGARVALQRCPILRTSTPILPLLSPFKRGHLYFGILGTFLLWVDRVDKTLDTSPRIVLVSCLIL